MRFNEGNIDRAMTAALGIPLKVAITQEAVDVADMTPGESFFFNQVATTPRLDSWLKGRAALKRLLAYLGEDQDTSALVFPHRRFSLSHTGEYAVALGSQGLGLEGTGIDLELNRIIRPEAARFFLTNHEQRWVTRLPRPAQSVNLLRLWTVKEALFKADPFNGATGLPDYVLEDPGHDTGNAIRKAEKPLHMRYVSFQLEQGFLSIAIAR